MFNTILKIVPGLPDFILFKMNNIVLYALRCKEIRNICDRIINEFFIYTESLKNMKQKWTYLLRFINKNTL